METNLADYLTIDPNALSIINATTDIYNGPFHKIENMDAFPSVSNVINESREQTGVSVAAKNKAALDQAWRAQMRKIFDSSEPNVSKQLDDYEATGKSNGYNLGLQIMVLSPGKYFKIHAHPNIEFEYTMVGTLREFRWMTFRMDATALRRGPPKNDDKQQPLRGPDIAATCLFEEKTCPQNHCMINAKGSVHQSFTSADEACAILVLWSQCHANTHPSQVFNKDPRLRPNAGW